MNNFRSNLAARDARQSLGLAWLALCVIVWGAVAGGCDRSRLCRDSKIQSKDPPKFELKNFQIQEWAGLYSIRSEDIEEFIYTNKEKGWLIGLTDSRPISEFQRGGVSGPSLKQEGEHGDELQVRDLFYYYYKTKVDLAGPSVLSAGSTRAERNEKIQRVINSLAGSSDSAQGGG